MASTKKYPKDFVEWMDDNTIHTTDGYLEQTTQYRKVFPTLDELYKFFKKEFR
jgi:hypothetical protein